MSEGAIIEECLRLLDKCRIRTNNAKTPIRKSIVSKHNVGIIKKFIRELLLTDKEMTVFNYFYALHAFGEFLGKKRFEGIGREDFFNYWSYLKTRGDLRTTNKTRKLSDSTMQTMIARMKRFYRWINEGETPKWLKDIKITSYGNKLDPDKVLTEDDIKRLLNVSSSPKDKAIVALLYESGARIAEFLGIRLSDLAFDEYGAWVKLKTGKLRKNEPTEVRKIRIVNSVSYLKAWMRYHPDLKEFFKEKTTGDFNFYNKICENNDNWLWVSKIQTKTDKLLCNEKTERFAVADTLQKLAEKAGILKPINPHAFRRSRATYLASKIPESVLRKFMGWKKDSVMVKAYVHLNDAEVGDVILDKVYNTQTKKLEEAINKLTPKVCKNCGERNPTDYNFCMKCNFPLSEDEIKGIEGRAVTITLTPEIIGQLQKMRFLRGQMK